MGEKGHIAEWSQEVLRREGGCGEVEAADLRVPVLQEQAGGVWSRAL